MHRPVLSAVVSAVAVGGLLASSASAVAPPTFASSRVFFHCAATKAGNVGAVQGGLPSWDATAPTASVQSGAGCGSTNTPGLSGTTHATPYDAVWRGSFTGNLTSLTLELHSIYAGTGRADGTVGILAEVGVDGVIYKVPAVVEAAATPSSTRASEKVLVSLTGLNLTEDLDRDGVADEGAGTTTRALTIKVRNGYVDANPLGAFVYDTTEVPAGVTFNPATLESARAALVKA